MGSAQSYISSELINVALTGIAIAGAVGISYGRHVKQNDDGISDNPKKRKGRTKGPPERVSSRVISSGLSGPQVTETSDTIMPGQFDANSPPVTQNSLAPDNVILKPKKSKRKKNKDAQDAEKISSITAEYHSESSMQTVYKSRIITKRSPQPQTPGIPLRPEIPSLISTTSLDTDDSWTQVGSRHPRQPIRVPPYGESQSEAGASQKDERSPVQNAAEDDPHDSFLLQQSVLPSSRDVENRKTLAKKLLPRPRKPGVDDMLETSEYPNPARVIRVAPLLNENPAAGLSWADYVDVRVSTDGGENDADGEDDGWGVVTSKRPKRLNMTSSTTSNSNTSQAPKAPESLTKKQRQNAQKRDRQKAAKAAAETQRLATLAGHKREAEKARMEDLFGKASDTKRPSGGMKATVDERGKLIWE